MQADESIVQSSDIRNKEPTTTIESDKMHDCSGKLDSGPGGTQKVYKKSSHNGLLTLYIGVREIVTNGTHVKPISGVLVVDPTILNLHRFYVQLTLTFRYGREDEEVMGLRFCNEVPMSVQQIWPPMDDVKNQSLSPLQEALIQKIGTNCLPFSLKVSADAPPSVKLVSSKEYYGAPIGTTYDVKCFIADKTDEKFYRHTIVRMGVRVIHRATVNYLNTFLDNLTLLDNNQSSTNSTPVELTRTSSAVEKCSRLWKSERAESFNKIKMSPKTFRFPGKLYRSKSEVEKKLPIGDFGLSKHEFSRGPQRSVDKPFLLQEGRVQLQASLDRSWYSHDDDIIVSLSIRNLSRKTVRQIRVTAVQYVDVLMFSNGKFKNTVAENVSDNVVNPHSTLDITYMLKPKRSTTKNWIALEDTLQRTNYEKSTENQGQIAVSAVQFNTSTNEINVFSISVHYYVKVKLNLSGIGGELSLKLPYTLVYKDEMDFDENIQLPNTSSEIVTEDDQQSLKVEQDDVQGNDDDDADDEETNLLNTKHEIPVDVHVSSGDIP